MPLTLRTLAERRSAVVEQPQGARRPRRLGTFVFLAALVVVLILAVVAHRHLTHSKTRPYVEAAQAELDRLNVPSEGRCPEVVVNGKEVTVTYPPPEGARAGSFILKMDRETLKMLDVQIWR
ncbi:MAG: hypothetical protein ACYTFI_03230 [Planctomycetota bacterium]